MKVGSLQLRLLLRESRSLKDKRQVVRSMKDKLRNSFNISVAEVDAEEDCRLIVLGVAMVSNEAGHIQQSFNQIVQAVRVHPVAEFLGHEMEV